MNSLLTLNINIIIFTFPVDIIYFFGGGGGVPGFVDVINRMNKALQWHRTAPVACDANEMLI